ncbi:MAG: hypothetical protein PHC95_15640 [Parabacteroides sp.]|nr:hypothetical protein [Parabacteroides sp.]
MKKQVILLLLCLSFSFAFLPLISATNAISLEENYALDLKELGLFKGVGTNADGSVNFDLKRASTRVEALVMLIRLLGEENAAVACLDPCVFTDVPIWAQCYVAYAYNQGYTNGSTYDSENDIYIFGTGNVTAQMYCTFVLRALGYSDSNDEDFSFNNAIHFASSVGILPEKLDVNDFRRSDMVIVSYAALDMYLKGSNLTLADKLVNSGVFTRLQYDTIYDNTGLESYSSISEDSTVKTVFYKWEYPVGIIDWSFSLKIPSEAYKAYRSVDRNYIFGYTEYITEPSDDEYLSELAQMFVKNTAKHELSEWDTVNMIISFVQNLDYISDGYDEYPKYPLETLYDKGGDCEDTSILLASLLKELGYGCALIMFDDHMGVGIFGGDSVDGYYFEKYGHKLFYIETTAPGWQIGEMPEDYIGQSALIIFP